MIDIDIKLIRDNFDVNINETFDDGITGIYGPSGSGKTSLLHAISGLAIPSSGKISIQNKTIFNSDEKINIPVEKRNIGYVFQEGRLFPHMSVEKNLQYGIKKNKSEKISFSEVVDLLNLSHILKSKATNISGGERQRTALGRSLLSSPNILLLDEPFSAVDTALRKQILPFLIKIHKTVKIPLLVVSHDMPDLLKLSNRICLITQGKCIGHNDYHKLLIQKDVQEIFGTDSLINAVSLKAEYVDNGSGLTVLSAENSENKVRVLCEKSRLEYQKGEEIKIFIKPDDIALADKRVEGITIQNQLEGIITDIIDRKNIILCIVDVGFPLIVEITAQSLTRMKIIKGSKVWCLFKSVAIDLAV